MFNIFISTVAALTTESSQSSSVRVLVNSHRPTQRNSTVELGRVGRCELTISVL